MKKVLVPVLAVLALAVGYKVFFSSPPVRNASPAGETIICFGDSLTFGTGASENMDYPSRLSRLISKPVINAGVPGDTTETALARLEEDVLSRSPRMVLLTLGGNDLKNGVAVESAYQNLKKIILSIQDQGALVIVGGISIPFWGRGFGDMYEKVCAETGSVLIPNLFDGIMGNKNLMSDPIHPNDSGYALMAEKFYRAMKPYL